MSEKIKKTVEKTAKKKDTVVIDKREDAVIDTEINTATENKIDTTIQKPKSLIIKLENLKASNRSSVQSDRK